MELELSQSNLSTSEFEEASKQAFASSAEAQKRLETDLAKAHKARLETNKLHAEALGVLEEDLLIAHLKKEELEIANLELQSKMSKQAAELQQQWLENEHDLQMNIERLADQNFEFEQNLTRAINERDGLQREWSEQQEHLEIMGHQLQQLQSAFEAAAHEKVALEDVNCELQAQV